MARILRGDIVWTDLNPTQGYEQAGLRPVLVLSQDIFNKRSGTVIACALTSQEPQARFPLALELSRSDQATTELKSRGYRMIIKSKKEPWGQTVSRLISPEGLLIGITFTPSMREEQ